MKYSQATLGRIFTVRLEDHDRLHVSIEKLAVTERIQRAAVLALGGADAGSALVTGPRHGRAAAVDPMELKLDNVHEFAAVGTIFPDVKGQPKLHMHAACGREGATRTGCVRAGVDIWHIGEVVILELTGNTMSRKKDPATGFDLLDI